jgi:predicted TIM-barrel fold metal-dependent hydrolase
LVLVYKIFSVDDHVVEPADVWIKRVPANYRDTAPHVIEENGRQFWMYEDKRGLTMGLNAVAGLPREQWNNEPTRFSDMIPGCYDPKERAKDMLSQGVLASVNFPTLPRFGGMLFNSFKDKDLADVCVQAWNDFILDEWCPGGPEGMFVPMIICHVWDPALAAREIERCVAKGAKALCFVENPVPEGLPSFNNAHWDPIWAAVQDADIPVCMHIGSSGSMPIGSDPEMSFLVPISLGSIAGMISMTNLLFTPVPHKFPKIKIVFSEAGIGWIPAALERADRQWERHRLWMHSAEMRPSDIFRRNMWCCMVEEPIGLSLHELIGVDRIVSETDYPHADTPYPYTQKGYAEVIAGIPDDVVEKVSHGNAEHLFRWKMADESLLTSPDVESWRAALDANPYAARGFRHDLETEHGTVHSGRTCTAVVYRPPNGEECGAPIGPDGRCAMGHVTAA